MNLENKVIVITGASSGIGAATAKRLAKAGAKVVLTARREEQLQDLQEEIKANDGEALVVVADVTNKDDMRQVAAKAKSTFGTINGIINNAGVMPLSYIDKLKTEEWDQMVSVNIIILQKWDTFELGLFRLKGIFFSPLAKVER